MALLSKFFGRTASEGAAFALGLATGPVLAPEVQELVNKTWALNPSRTLEAGDAAEIVAEDVERRDWGAGESAAHGVNGDRFDALVGAVLNAPGFADLLELRRRNLITAAQFEHGLRKARLETLWDDGLVGLEDVLLSVADLANAVVQGHMAQDAAAAEADKQGVSADRFDVLVQNTGLPPGPAELLAWLRRGIIDEGEFEQGIREGHTKVKYIPKYEAALHPLLSAATAVRLYLKGWYTKAQRDELGSQWGYTSGQMEDWFLSEGRPATAHQIHIGYQRGAKLEGASDEVEAIRTSVKQSDIRPEYADLIVAGRYTYPPFFALRTLAQAQVLSEAEMLQVLKFEGWEPTFAAKVAAFYAKPAAATQDENPYIGKADTQLWTALHKAYVKTGAPRAEVEPLLTVLIPDAAPRGTVFQRWDDERTTQSLAPPPAAP